jgi:hypothetical protein
MNRVMMMAVAGLAMAGTARAQQNPQPSTPAPAPAPAPGPASPGSQGTPASSSPPASSPPRAGSTPATQPATTTTPAAPPMTAVPATRAASGSPTWFRDRLGGMLQGIALDVTQRQRIDSVLTANSIALSASAADSTIDAAGRERILSMVGPIDAAVRAILVPAQQDVWDRNVSAWQQRQHP